MRARFAGNITRRYRAPSTAVAFVVVGFLVFPMPVAFATDGDLDPSFDSDGKVTSDPVEGKIDRIESIALQEDGKIIAGGYIYDGTQTDLLLARYNSDGSVDTDFGLDGFVIDDLGGNEEIISVAVADDGIVVGGHQASNDYVVAKYDFDGAPVESFGTDGALWIDIDVYDIMGEIDLQADGKIVLAGGSGDGSVGDFAVVRVLADGSGLDPDFGSDGVVRTGFGGEWAGAETVQVADSGEIVVAGSAYIDPVWVGALARYDEDGLPDDSFGGDGSVTAAFGAGGDDAILAIAVDSSARIVAAGYSYTAGGSDAEFAVARYGPDGVLDPSFATDGVATLNHGDEHDQFNAVVVDRWGRIVAGGEADGSGPSTRSFALARFGDDGSLDTTFGSNGLVTTSFVIGSSDQSALHSLVIQPDDKIVAGGVSRTLSGNHNSTLARYVVEAPGPPPRPPQAPTYYDLTVSKTGTGSGEVVSDPHMGIDCGPTCTSSLAKGTYGILKATPDEGSTFTGWSGGPCLSRGAWFDKPDECAIRLDSDRTVTATFTEDVPPPPCSDGQDNDSDGLADFPSDPGCSSAEDDDETDPPPEFHERQLTADAEHVKGRLRFSGALTVTSGYEPCTSDLIVLQKREDGAWGDFRSTATDPSGSYGFTIKDKEGNYRTIVRRMTSSEGPPRIDCLYASSGRLKHRH